MAKPHRPWVVTPHQTLQKLEDNLWALESRVPGVPFNRRMAIVKRSDGTLVFYHAVPMDEPTLAEILAWGTPAVLVLGHDNHGVDAHAFAQKLSLKIYGPKKIERRMRARWDLAGTVDELPADPALSFEAMDGTKKGEPVAIVTSGARVSLLFSDAYQDNQNLNLVFRLLGFGGGPKVSPAFKLLLTYDKPALKAHLTRLAGLPGLTRIVPCHGKITDVDAPTVLRKVAADA